MSSDEKSSNIDCDKNGVCVSSANTLFFLKPEKAVITSNFKKDMHETFLVILFCHWFSVTFEISSSIKSSLKILRRYEIKSTSDKIASNLESINSRKAQIKTISIRMKSTAG